MSRRIKISFETINEPGTYTIANPADVHAANDRIKIAMNEKAMEYNRKAIASVLDARNLMLIR